MADKKYSLGKKEMSTKEFEEMQTYPYQDERGRRFSNEELKTFRPPGGKLTNVGAGSPEYGGYNAGAGRGLLGGMTAAQAKAMNLKNAEQKGTYRPLSERVEDVNTMRQAEEDDAEQNVQRKRYAKGGMTASSRADGCAQRGKTRGKMV